jgi:hypothetical protein
MGVITLLERRMFAHGPACVTFYSGDHVVDLPLEPVWILVTGLQKGLFAPGCVAKFLI